jgi:hypothetical protein
LFFVVKVIKETQAQDLGDVFGFYSPVYGSVAGFAFPALEVPYVNWFTWDSKAPKELQIQKIRNIQTDSCTKPVT